MYTKPYNRKFGIEFEFNMNVTSVMEARGLFSKYEGLSHLLIENQLEDFTVHGDGSEFEVRTPILSGSHGFKKVKKFLDLIVSGGGRTNYLDGLHVHHDAPEFIHNKRNVVRLIENWLENQNEILKMVDPYRNNAVACPIWTHDRLFELKQNDGRINFGRRNLNINSLSRHGTIEIRLHEGTLNYDEVFSWVRFGQAFIAKALDESEEVLSPAESPYELLKRINVSRNASRFITKKSRNLYGSV